jgi:hypothetical protein
VGRLGVVLAACSDSRVACRFFSRIPSGVVERERFPKLIKRAGRLCGLFKKLSLNLNVILEN